MSKSIYLVFVILHGFLSLSYEILAIRLFAPFFGSGTEQTSFIIGGVLLFYSLGNYCSKENFDQDKLWRNIFLLCLLIGVVLSHPGLHHLQVVFDLLGFRNFYLKLSLSALLCIAPIAFLFGQNFPYLLKSDHQLGLSKVLAFSTLGCFLGSIGTALLLVNVISASQMVLINTVLVAILGTFLSERLKFLALLPVLFITVVTNVWLMRDLVQWETGVATYDVQEKDFGKVLLINKAKWTSLIEHDGDSAPYNEYVHSLILDDPQPKKVLVLGAGGLTLSLKNQHHDYTYVDVDPKIADIIKQDFNPNGVGKVVISDAREFLLKNTEKYDLIFQDVFERLVMPPHLNTFGHFKKIKDSLTENGYFAFNIIHEGVFTGTRGSKLGRTVQAVFGACYFIPVSMEVPLYTQRKMRHTLALCQPSSQGKDIITDDKY